MSNPGNKIPFTVIINPGSANVASIRLNVKAYSAESAERIARKWFDTNDNHIARLSIGKRPMVYPSMIRFIVTED